MAKLRGFPPNANSKACKLILGSMPGTASLQVAQYYAHPRNAFWKIMHRVLDIAPELPYRQRLAALRAHGIALWDVMECCLRQGSSLDSAIDDSSIVPNDFAAFFAAHPRITQVYFNGGKADQVYRKFVLPRLGTRFNHIAYKKLLSTSPANATYSLQRKIDAWRIIKL